MKGEYSGMSYTSETKDGMVRRVTYVVAQCIGALLVKYGQGLAASNMAHANVVK